jgi:hypothetical protein
MQITSKHDDKQTQTNDRSTQHDRNAYAAP